MSLRASSVHSKGGLMSYQYIRVRAVEAAPSRQALRVSRQLAAGVTAGLYCAAALAQSTGPASSAAEPAQTGQLEEVVVTAQYRAENLQQTPIAITAITAADLEQQNLTNVDDLGSVVPNAYFRTPSSVYGPTETIGLRGITQVDYSYNFEPAVGLYV